MGSAAPSGGLFGGQKPQSTGGALFGGAPKPATGLFGGGGTTTGMSAASSGGIFGSKPATSGGGLFGGSSTTQQKSTFFSGSQPTGSFGQGASTGMGGSQSAQLENGTSAIKFSGIKDKDQGDSKVLITLNAITADPSYCQFSLEELRMADYVLKKQGKVNFPIGTQPAQTQPTTGFGSGSSFGASSTQPKSGGLFGGSSQSTSGGSSLFGRKFTCTQIHNFTLIFKIVL